MESATLIRIGGSSPKRVGRKTCIWATKALRFRRFLASSRVETADMMRRCEHHVGWMRRIGLPDSVPSPRSVASSAIPRRGSCGSGDGGKGGLRGPWTEASDLLRPQDPSRARPLLWRHSCLPGSRGPARALPELRLREAREAALVGRQPANRHETGPESDRRAPSPAGAVALPPPPVHPLFRGRSKHPSLY